MSSRTNASNGLVLCLTGLLLASAAPVEVSAQVRAMAADPASQSARTGGGQEPAEEPGDDPGYAPAPPDPVITPVGPQHVWVTHYGEYVDYDNNFANSGVQRVDGQIHASNGASETAKVRIQGFTRSGVAEYRRDIFVQPGGTAQLMPTRDFYSEAEEVTWVVTSDRHLILTGFAEVYQRHRMVDVDYVQGLAVAWQSQALGKRDLTIVKADCSLADHGFFCSAATRDYGWNVLLIDLE